MKWRHLETSEWPWRCVSHGVWRHDFCSTDNVWSLIVCTHIRKWKKKLNLITLSFIFCNKTFKILDSLKRWIFVLCQSFIHPITKSPLPIEMNRDAINPLHPIAKIVFLWRTILMDNIFLDKNTLFKTGLRIKPFVYHDEFITPPSDVWWHHDTNKDFRVYYKRLNKLTIVFVY